MTSLAARVLATIRRRRLCDRHARVVAAVSGGADSVALAHLLAELSHAAALSVVGVAHLDHCLRGAESARDREFCRDARRRLDCPSTSKPSTSPARPRRRANRSRRPHASVRYAFLERARARCERRRRGRGPHARRSGGDGAAAAVPRRRARAASAAIPPARDRVIRPLIDLAPREIVGYLEDRRRTWVEDSTNQDARLPRNWVRHELLPRSRVEPATA